MRGVRCSLTALEPNGGDSTGHSTSFDDHVDYHKGGIKQVDSFVQLMRLIPQGLVLVFANEHLKNMGTDSLSWLGKKGMLVSSFNSITIEPEPFVSFNVKVPSSTFEEIKETGSFTVLAVNNAYVANAFTAQSEESNIVLDRMKRSTPTGLANQGFIWWMQCEFMPEKSVTVGDHVIVVGRVAGLGTFPGMLQEQALLYSSGSYRLPGARIKPENDARIHSYLAGTAKLRAGDNQAQSLGSWFNEDEGRVVEGENTKKHL